MDGACGSNILAIGRGYEAFQSSHIVDVVYVAKEIRCGKGDSTG